MIPVVALWSLVSIYGVYVLFFKKKPKESSSNPVLTLLIVLLLLTGLAILVSLIVPGFPHVHPGSLDQRG